MLACGAATAKALDHCSFCAYARKYNGAINAMLADQTAKARFTDLGASLLPASSADFVKLIADETEKWGKVIKFAGIKPE
jgi:tripartite-type tricarboxylate transporter receptor subunit TctC